MLYEFRLPDIGEGVAEGEVVRWLVKEGDVLQEDQPMVEIMTDKATVEIPTPRAGRVAKLMFAEGQICPVGKVLIAIEVEARAFDRRRRLRRWPPPPCRRPPRRAERAPSRQRRERARRGRARDAGHAQAGARRGRRHSHGGGDGAGRAGHVGRRAGARGIVPRPRRERTPPGTVTRASRSAGVRRKIAEHMVRSKHTAAHFTYVEEIDCTDLVALRERANARAAARGDASCRSCPSSSRRRSRRW